MGNENLKKIAWEKITQNRFLKSKNDINNLYNCNLDDNKYEKLRMGWLRANKKYSQGSKNSETIHNFINKTVKGSKRYRTLLERDNAKNYCKALKLLQLKTYKKLTHIADITENRAKSMYGAWNKLFLSSEIKVFLYKFYNNILGTNLRVSKFNRKRFHVFHSQLVFESFQQFRYTLVLCRFEILQHPLLLIDKTSHPKHPKHGRIYCSVDII